MALGCESPAFWFSLAAIVKFTQPRAHSLAKSAVTASESQFPTYRLIVADRHHDVLFGRNLEGRVGDVREELAQVDEETVLEEGEEVDVTGGDPVEGAGPLEHDERRGGEVDVDGEEAVLHLGEDDGQREVVLVPADAHAAGVEAERGVCRGDVAVLPHHLLDPTEELLRQEELSAGQVPQEEDAAV